MPPSGAVERPEHAFQGNPPIRSIDQLLDLFPIHRSVEHDCRPAVLPKVAGGREARVLNEKRLIHDGQVEGCPRAAGVGAVDAERLLPRLPPRPAELLDLDGLRVAQTELAQARNVRLDGLSRAGGPSGAKYSPAPDPPFEPFRSGRDEIRSRGRSIRTPGATTQQPIAGGLVVAFGGRFCLTHLSDPATLVFIKK